MSLPKPSPRPWRIRPGQWDHLGDFDGAELLDARGNGLGLNMDDESPGVWANAEHAIQCVNLAQDIRDTSAVVVSKALLREAVDELELLAKATGSPVTAMKAEMLRAALGDGGK